MSINNNIIGLFLCSPSKFNGEAYNNSYSVYSDYYYIILAIIVCKVHSSARPTITLCMAVNLPESLIKSLASRQPHPRAHPHTYACAHAVQNFKYRYAVKLCGCSYWAVHPHCCQVTGFFVVVVVCLFVLHTKHCPRRSMCSSINIYTSDYHDLPQLLS